MCAQKHDEKPNLVLAMFKNKCPRCRRGDLYKFKGAFRFRGLMRMNETCPVCGQPLDMEPGFYYGTNLISYALAVLTSVVSFLLLVLIVGISSLDESRLIWWISLNAVLLVILQLPLMRLSRTIWLAFFVRYSPRWSEGDVVKQFSINKEQQNNW